MTAPVSDGADRNDRHPSATMQTLTIDQYQDLIRDAKVLSRDEHGEKVLLRPDGTIVKLFRRKRLISSALIVPYAVRFAKASEELHKRGFRSVRVLDVYRVPHIRRHAVTYPMLAGTSLREVLAQSNARRDELLTHLAAMMAKMHDRGVYFRAGHFGNVLVCDDGELALIDISETRLFRASVSPRLRAASFRPLLSYREDAEALRAFGGERFVREYLAATDIPSAPRDALLRRLSQIAPMFRLTSAISPAAVGGSS